MPAPLVGLAWVVWIGRIDRCVGRFLKVGIVHPVPSDELELVFYRGLVGEEMQAPIDTVVHSRIVRCGELAVIVPQGRAKGRPAAQDPVRLGVIFVESDLVLTV